MRLLPKKATHKILCLLLIPLCCQTLFLGAVVHSFNRLEADRTREGRALDNLLHVNMTFNDMVSAAASLMMFSIWQEPGYLLEFNDKYSVLKRNASDLKKYSSPNQGGSSEIAALTSIMNDAIGTFESVDEISDDHFEKHNPSSTEKLKGFLKRMDNACRGAMEQQLANRERYEKIESVRREQFKTMIFAFALIEVITAIALAIIFTMTFARSFQRLVTDTEKVRRGQLLERPIEGSDEIAALDQLVYKLSHELEAARKMERAMIDNTSEIICSIDEGHKLQEVNQAVAKRLGYEPGEIIGVNIQSLMHPDDRDETYKELEYCKNVVEEVTFQARLKRKDSRFTDTEWNTKWSPENKSFFCVIHDIAERREAERLKQEVLAMVSHDLRAPLTSLGMTLDMVHAGVVGELDERGERLISRAKYSVSALISMINDLIDVERFEAGGIKLNYEEVEVKSIIGPALDLVSPEAERKKIKLTTELDSFSLKVDKERLNRVVMNLVNNAIKFTPDGKSITLTAKLMQSKSGRPFAEFQIIDEGPGIASDKLELVFEKFKQAGTGSEGERVGSGLGLAICKAIVEAHHGNIGINSELGQGSTFWFKIPQAPTG